MNLKTESQARSEFAAYFLDLQENMARDGAIVNKQAEWDTFIQAELDEGRVSPEARAWKCPRSLKALVHAA